MNYALKETLKSAARGLYFAVLGLISLVLTVIISSPDVAKAMITLPIVNTPVSAGVLIITAVTALLKIVDRYRHLDSSPSKGIAPSFLQK